MRAKGFSLLELMISVGLGSVLLLLGYQLLTENRTQETQTIDTGILTIGSLANLDQLREEMINLARLHSNGMENESHLHMDHTANPRVENYLGIIDLPLDHSSINGRCSPDFKAYLYTSIQSEIDATVLEYAWRNGPDGEGDVNNTFTIKFDPRENQIFKDFANRNYAINPQELIVLDREGAFVVGRFQVTSRPAHPVFDRGGFDVARRDVLEVEALRPKLLDHEDRLPYLDHQFISGSLVMPVETSILCLGPKDQTQADQTPGNTVLKKINISSDTEKIILDPTQDGFHFEEFGLYFGASSPGVDLDPSDYLNSLYEPLVTNDYSYTIEEFRRCMNVMSLRISLKRSSSQGSRPNLDIKRDFVVQNYAFNRPQYCRNL